MLQPHIPECLDHLHNTQSLESIDAEQYFQNDKRLCKQKGIIFSHTIQRHQKLITQKPKMHVNVIDRFILITDIPAPAAMTHTTIYMNFSEPNPTPREKKARGRKEKNTSSHVLTDWYHITITVLMLVRHAEYTTASA